VRSPFDPALPARRSANTRSWAAEGTDVWRALVAAEIGELLARIARLQSIEAALHDSLSCACRAWDECTTVVGAPGPA
jgi:hypothetical protein